jgi:two-component system, cell cycle response regulator
MDGEELCRKVRQSSARSYSYFILLTSLEDAGHVVRGMEAGADDYLKKPFDLDDLTATLIAATRVTKLHERLHAQQAKLEVLNRRLFTESRHDPLTGLGNRLALHEEIALLNARASRYGHTYCIALYDVDYFKSFNDTAGHLAGDRVLREVAAELAAKCRGGDAVYRFGGEEFLSVLPEQTLELAGLAAERMRVAIQALAIPHLGRGPGTFVTVSAGVAQLEESDGGEIDAITRRADAGLYLSKERGRNRVELAPAVDTLDSQPV